VWPLGAGGSGRRGSRTPAAGGDSASSIGTAHPPCPHIHEYAKRSTNGSIDHTRTQPGIDRGRANAPCGGSHDQPGRAPGGCSHYLQARFGVPKRTPRAKKSSGCANNDMVAARAASVSDGRRVIGQLTFQARRDRAKPFGDGLSFVCPVQRFTQHCELVVGQSQRIELCAALTVAIAQAIWIV
jgi:hypothetical protein